MKKLNKTALRLTVLLTALLCVTGCGKIDRTLAGWTGDASEVCVDGVLYLQFTSGVSVAYDASGNIKRCK